MDTWEKETIIKIVDAFLDERFPTVIVSGYGFDLFVSHQRRLLTRLTSCIMYL